MPDKQKILNYYLQLIQDKIDIFQDMIFKLTVDAQNDAKGSAGDKHETALSMMHLEQEKINTKLKEALLQQEILKSLDISNQKKHVSLGSLVQANNLVLFVSTAMPKIIINQQVIFAISPQSPLGSAIMGNLVGHSFKINQTDYTINSIE